MFICNLVIPEILEEVENASNPRIYKTCLLKWQAYLTYELLFRTCKNITLVAKHSCKCSFTRTDLLMKTWSQKHFKEKCGHLMFKNVTFFASKVDFIIWNGLNPWPHTCHKAWTVLIRLLPLRNLIQRF